MKPDSEAYAPPIRQIGAAPMGVDPCKPRRLTPANGWTSLYGDVAMVALLAKLSTPKVKVSGCADAVGMGSGIDYWHAREAQHKALT